MDTTSIPVYDPWKDPQATPAEMMENFKINVSSYFEHPDPPTQDLWKLDLRPRADRTSTMSWTREQHLRYTELFPGRSEWPLYVR